MKFISCFLVLCLLLLPQVGCIKKNAEGRRAVRLIPSSIINSQSSVAYSKQKKEVPLSKNQRWTQINRRVADRLIAIANRSYSEYSKGFKWEVNLFEQSETVNAYCMPGGKIGIYTGILPVCQTEAALAAVMGHEIAHALLEHGNERVSQQMGVQATLLIAQAGLSVKSGLDKKMQGVILGAAGMGAQLGLILPFSRSHESEADKMGLRLMAAAGYDPSEAPNLWRRMKQKSGGKAPPLILSTHPSNDQRIRKLTELQSSVRDLYQASPKYGLGEKL